MSLLQILYNDHKFLRSVTLANPSIDKRLWSTSQQSFEYISETSWKLVNKDSLTWWYVLNTPWRRLQNVLKTSWRCPEDVLKTSWRRMTKMSILILIKTSSRRLHQDECLLGNNLILLFMSSYFLDPNNVQYLFLS